ncbi:MFS transporter [Corynebacterium sp. 335C]
MNLAAPTRRALPRQDDATRRRRALTVLALSIGAFGIGTTEFVAMGLLPYIAADFDVSEAVAGQVITAYALGVVVGAPLITAVTGRVPRRRMLLLLMAAFTLGNALTVFAGSHGMLMASRFIAGLPHGAYFSVAALVAASLAEPGKRGRAVALSGMGLSVATVAGVPAAQALGAQVGWHAAFVFVALVGVVTLVALWFTVPHMVRMRPTSPLTELGALARPQVWFTVAMGTVGFGGMFAVYTYISWTMTEVAGFPADLMWIVLMAYGIGMVLGTYLGGFVADRNLEYGVLGSFIAILVALVAFHWTSQHAVAAIINFGLVGLLGSTLVPNLQTRLMDVAGEAQTLAAALNQAALNMANAGGAAIGGAVIAAGFGYRAPSLAGAAMALTAIIIWFPAHALLVRSQRKRTELA